MASISANSGKPRPAWSEPVWVKDTTYRLVNVGDGPAFDVFVDGEAPNPMFDLPFGTIKQAHYDVIKPGGAIDIVAEVRDLTLPPRPLDTDPGVVGWPPVAPSVRLAWNTKKNWSPRVDDADPFWFAEKFGVRRQHYSSQSLPLNRLPLPSVGPGRRQRREKGEAVAEFVQFERVLNVYLMSSDALRKALDEWEKPEIHAKSLFSDDARVSVQAWADLRQAFDPLIVTLFVSHSMLNDHAKRLRARCDSADRRTFDSTRDRLMKNAPVARHAETIRNYFVHQGLLDLRPSYSYDDNAVTIEIDPAPVLGWAQTRDKKRSDPENVQFAEFVKGFVKFAGSGPPSLRDWMEQLLQATHSPILELYRAGLRLIGESS